jgi:hypothetical protein
VRQVPVVDPIAAGWAGDYADAFEVELAGPDRCRPEEWVRAGIGSTPGWVKRVVRLLGFGRGPIAQGQVGPWRVVESTAEVVHLETSLPLMDVLMVGRRVPGDRRTLTSVLRYRRPWAARLVWAVIGPGHRRTARGVLTCLLPAAAGEGTPFPAGPKPEAGRG